MKVCPCEDNPDGRKDYLFECPGCGGAHFFRTEGPAPVWTWNGSLESPTVTPSIKATWKDQDGADHCCHFHLTDGQIAFCGDCTHELSGKTVPMIDWQ